MDPERLKGKNILITGAARGMGAANAEAFAAQGANVTLGDLDEGAAQEVADRINAAGNGRAIAVKMDVTKRADNAAGDKDVLNGSQFGTHWAVGGQILLDIFDRDRASLLEAQTGINDSWLVVEYRQQQLAGEGGFDFSGTLLSAGLKFDF